VLEEVEREIKKINDFNIFSKGQNRGLEFYAQEYLKTKVQVIS